MNNPIEQFNADVRWSVAYGMYDVSVNVANGWEPVFTGLDRKKAEATFRVLVRFVEHKEERREHRRAKIGSTTREDIEESPEGIPEGAGDGARGEG